MPSPSSGEIRQSVSHQAAHRTARCTAWLAALLARRDSEKCEQRSEVNVTVPFQNMHSGSMDDCSFHRASASLGHASKTVPSVVAFTSGGGAGGAPPKKLPAANAVATVLFSIAFVPD